MKERFQAFLNGDLLPLLTAAGSVAWAMLLPIQSLMIVTGMIVMADLVTGIWKSIRLKGWKSFSSRRLRETIGKSVLYQISIVVAFGLDHILGNGDAPILARVMAAGVASVEVVSIMENIRDLTGVDVVSILMSKFKPPAKKDDDA